MTIAADLPSAAGLAFNNLQIKWLSNNLKSALTAFWQGTIATFPEQEISSHPVSNWLSVIASIADQLTATNVPYDGLTNAANAVYRLCWMTNYLDITNQITDAQARLGPNSILVQYNSAFG
jgi:hypothetical protein